MLILVIITYANFRVFAKVTEACIRIIVSNSLHNYWQAFVIIITKKKCIDNSGDFVN